MTTYAHITRRLDNPCVVRKCRCGSSLTVDRSIAGVRLIECSNPFCDFVLIARRVGRKWVARRLDEIEVTATTRRFDRPFAGGEA